MKNYLKRALALVLAFSMCASMAVVGASAAKYDLTTDNLADLKEVNEVEVGEWLDVAVEYDDDSKVLGSFTGGGNDQTTVAGDDYDYDAALWIEEDGVYSNPYKTWNGVMTVDGSITDNKAEGIVINGTENYNGENGIIIHDRDYVLEHITINMGNLDADGHNTCDFSGKGTAIAVFGDVDVTVEDATVICTGVAVMPMFCDDGATVTVMDSYLEAKGGVVYDKYVNSPDQSTMVAPPWILGIMGNARCTNLEGNNSTFNFINVEAVASNWAVLSTDSGQNMYMNMYNTSLTLTGADESAINGGLGFGGGAQTTTATGNLEVLDNPYTENYGTGYGTYTIGSAVETFAGATLNVGTYATIFTGGTCTFTSITEGETYTLKSADGKSDVEWVATWEDEVAAVSADKRTKNTVVNSDTFGLMAHQNNNTLVIEKGTVINSGYTTFLVKSGQQLTATIDNSELNPGNGILIQMMDNDDSTTGMPNGFAAGFATTHTEEEGFRTEGFAELGSKTSTFTFTNGHYEGNIYNGTGSSRPANAGTSVQSAEVLNIVVGKNGELAGAIAKTATVHTTFAGQAELEEEYGYAAIETAKEAELFTKFYQNTEITISEYYDLGQVANMIAKNSNAGINVELTDNAVWFVTGTSVIDSLTLSGTAHVVVKPGVVLTINGVEYTDCTLYAEANAGASLLPITIGSKGSSDNGNGTGWYFAAPRYASIENEGGKVKVDDNVSWHNGVVLDAPGEYNLTGYVSMMSSADGTDTNDFSGLGAAVMVNGNDNAGKAPTDNPNGGAVVAYIDEMSIETSGVAKLALFTDNGGVSVVTNSELIAWGGTIYDKYRSTADMAMMVSPPWVLGLGGNDAAPCNARTTNLMGDYSAVAYVDSYIYAAGWGALSVDGGTNMNMVVVNSDVKVDNSGYGAYNIGESTEQYYGVRMDVSTYAIIMTGGKAVITDYVGGEKIKFTQYGDDEIMDTVTTNMLGTKFETKIVRDLGAGTEIAKLTSEKVAQGETVVSRIKSDNFGFMCHANGPGYGNNTWNIIEIDAGTKITTGDAIFLVKKVNADITVEDVKMDSANDVILQIIDNDDDYVGVMPATLEAWGFNDGYNHTDATHEVTFNTVFEEEAGYSNEWEGEKYASAAANVAGYDVANNWVVNYKMTDTIATGDLWNSTGYAGANPATTMNVTLGKDAVLTGIISAGAYSHTTKYAEVGNGDWTGAEALGHVTNVVNSNDVNIVNVKLKEDAHWIMTGDAVINTLKVEDTSLVYIPEGVTLTVLDEGVYYTNTIVKKDTAGIPIGQPAPEVEAPEYVQPETPDVPNDEPFDDSWEVETPVKPEPEAPAPAPASKTVYGVVVEAAEAGQGGGMGGPGGPGMGGEGGEPDDGRYVVWTQQPAKNVVLNAKGEVESYELWTADEKLAVGAHHPKLAIKNVADNGKTATMMGWYPGYVEVTATLYGAGGWTETYEDDILGTYKYLVKVEEVVGAPELYIVGVEYGEKYVATATDGTDDWFNSPSASSNVTGVYLSDGKYRAGNVHEVGTLVVKENGLWTQVDILDYLENKTALTNDVTDMATDNWQLVWCDDTYTASGFGKFMNMGGQNTEYTFRQALLVVDNKVVEDESVDKLLNGVKTSTEADIEALGSALTGATVISNGAFFNGVVIRGSEYTISDSKFYGNGDGADDFNGLAAMLFVTDSEEGASEVKLEKSYIETSGVIRTATSVMGTSKLYIDDTVIYTKESTDTQEEYDALVVPMMKKTPFALGLEGVVRATNVLGAGQGIYTDSIIVSTGWGALSTDSNVAGTEALNVDNVLGGIGEIEVAKAGKAYTATKEVNGVTYGFTMAGSGYVAYADAGVTDIFNNVEFYSNDYVQIMASNVSSAYYTNSKLVAGRIAVMTQQNAGGTISIKDSSVDAGDTVVQIKSHTVNAGGYTNVVLDNVDVNFDNDYLWSGVLVELVESDDAGSPGSTEFIVNDCGDTATKEDSVKEVEDSNATLKNGAYEGDIFNNVWQTTATLNVALEAADLTGTVSSSWSYHADKEGNRFENGTALKCDVSGDYRTSTPGEYVYIGAQVNVVAPTVNNPVTLTIDAASTWTVGEVNYIADLAVESTDSLLGNGTVYVDNFTVNGEAKAAGTWMYYNDEGIVVVVVDNDDTYMNEDEKPEPPKPEFDDVEEDDWFYNDVMDAAQAGIVNGYKNEDGTYSFKPHNNVTRAEAAKMIVAALGLEVGSGATSFEDVSADAWYAPYIAAAVEAGAMKGISATEFDPTGTLTRAQAAALMIQAKGIAAAGVASFPDVEASAWYSDDVAAAVAAGFVKGYTDGTYGPYKCVTRAELCTMIVRAFLAD